jgi:hypothetical protein
LAQRKDWIDRQIINPVVERLYGTVAFRGKDPVSITQSIQSMYDTSAAFENLDTLRDHKDYRQYITALLLEIGSQEIRKDDIAAILSFLMKYHNSITDHTITYVNNPPAYGRKDLLDELRESQDLCKAKLELCTQAGYITGQNQYNLAKGLEKMRDYHAAAQLRS